MSLTRVPYCRANVQAVKNNRENISIMFKKILSVIIAAAAFAALPSCGSNGSSKKEGKISVVCTIFPEYDWVKNITKDVKDVKITYLLENGADLHSYQPSAEDMLAISDCDLFIYAGGESDNWVDDALENKQNDDMKIINMLQTLSKVDMVKEEEVKEGMQPEEEEHEAAGEKEYDEHTWLSVTNAKLICSEINNALCDIDKDNKEKYKSNYSDYLNELNALDDDFKKLSSDAKQKTLIFGDRFPFRYFTDEYGFDYYAAFVGCSAETEASFQTIAFLAGKTDELNASTVFTIENSDGKIAQAIIDNTTARSAKTETLYSLQSVTKQQLDDGVTYISLMRKNLETLRKALC